MKFKSFFLLLLFLLLVLCWYWREVLCKIIFVFYSLVIDRAKIEQFIEVTGWASPLVFMLLQIVQVVFAPIPGELTGFLGGYFFGPLMGFLYSSLSLGIGSCINFFIGRFFGERYVRNIIPIRNLNQFDRWVNKKGVLILFVFFSIPGFPKDFLCLFLGITSITVPIFLFISIIGRMPGTFMLTLHGCFVFNKNYLIFLIFIVVVIVVGFVSKYWDSVCKILHDN